MDIGSVSSVVNICCIGLEATCVLAMNLYDGDEGPDWFREDSILKTMTSPFLVPMNRNEFE